MLNGSDVAPKVLCALSLFALSAAACDESEPKDAKRNTESFEFDPSACKLPDPPREWEPPWTSEQFEACMCPDLLNGGELLDDPSGCATETCPGFAEFKKCVIDLEAACRNQCDADEAVLECCVEQAGCDGDSECIYGASCGEPALELEGCHLVASNTDADCLAFALEDCLLVEGE